jgi:hypothetical protein
MEEISVTLGCELDETDDLLAAGQLLKFFSHLRREQRK